MVAVRYRRLAGARIPRKLPWDVTSAPDARVAPEREEAVGTCSVGVYMTLARRRLPVMFLPDHLHGMIGARLAALCDVAGRRDRVQEV